MLDATITTVESAGELYGVPLQAESIALFANMKLVQPLIDSNQLPADFTFDDIITLAKTYNDQISSKYLLGVDIDDYYVHTCSLHHLALNYLVLTMIILRNLAQMIRIWFKALKYIYEEYATKLVDNVRTRILPETTDLNGEFLSSKFNAGEMPFMFTGPWGNRNVCSSVSCGYY